MKVMIGLGNPGKEYVGTRHNVGYMVVDQLAGSKSWSQSKSGLFEHVWLRFNHSNSSPEAEKIELVKPLTFMNRSGQAAKLAMSRHPEITSTDLYVIHDDLDLELGNYKIQLGTGPQQHNGLRSIYETLNTQQFWHVRVGVDTRKGDRSIPPEKYVLSVFRPEERTVLEQVVNTLVERLHAETA